MSEPNDNTSYKFQPSDFEDINSFSFRIDCEDKKIPQSQNSKKEEEKDHKSIIESEIDFNPKANTEFSREYISPNGSNINDTLYLLTELQQKDDLKQSFSMFEDDYLQMRQLPKISLDTFNPLIRQFSRNELTNTKNEVDHLKCLGSTIGSISNIPDLIDLAFNRDKAKKKAVLNLSSTLEKSIYKWRLVKNDGNGFYRSVMFFYLENIIIQKKIQVLMNLIYDINQICSKEEYIKNILTKRKINKDKLILLLVLMYYALSLTDFKESIFKAHSLLITAFNNYTIFDCGLVLYLKFSLMQYLKNNKDMLYSKERSININNFLPREYHQKGKFLYDKFFEKELMPLGKEASSIVIYTTPFVIGANFRIFSFDYGKNDNNLKQFDFDSNGFIENSSKDNKITLICSGSNYEVIYQKDYYNKYSEYLDNALQKKKISNISNNNIESNQKLPLSNNISKKIEQGDNNEEEIQNNTLNFDRKYPESKRFNNTQDTFNKQSNRTSSGNENNQISESPLKQNEIDSNNNTIEKYILPTIQQNQSQNEIPNQNPIRKGSSCHQCPMCYRNTSSYLLCDYCQITYLKNWLKSSFVNFIKLNNSNIISNKPIISFQQYIKSVPIPYEKGQKYFFEEIFQSLPKQYQFNLFDYILSLKSSLCIRCCNHLNINENSISFSLPCGCSLCCPDCLIKFFKMMPLNIMKIYLCICGEEYDLIKLKYMINFLNSHHLKKAKNDMFKFIYEKIKNKCAKCTKVIQMDHSKGSKLNIIEINDKEADLIFKISRFNHLVCDSCWEELDKIIGNNQNNFICGLCNSAHDIIRREQKNQGIIRPSCNIF